ncbi:MAG: alpha/beta hydrolase [Actinomycetota bacterium]
MTESTHPTTGVAAGVPFLAVPPPGGGRPDSPVVVAWHLMDPPRTEAAMSAALPLDGLQAWRLYFGLPLAGSRMPAGGPEELNRLAFEDAVMNLHGPVVAQAAAEFPAAFEELRSRFGFGAGSLGLLGGSAGAAVAATVLAETEDLAVSAAVLVSPLLQLRPLVDAISRHYEMTYQWSVASESVAARIDFVARADEIAEHSEPAVLLVVGGNDFPDGILAPAERLRAALTSRYADPSRIALTTMPGMAHALAEEPGMEPAPQTAQAAEVDRLAVDWLRRHLT